MSDTPRTPRNPCRHGMYDNRICEICVEVLPLERELAAYQNAEMPEAPKVWTPSLMEDHWHETNWVEATDYDALAKRWAGMTARNERLTSEAKAFQMNYRLACDAETKRLTVELEAAQKDAERHKFAMRHVSYYSMQSRFLIDCEHESMPGSDTSMDYENSIDIALAAGKEKAE